MKKGTHKRPGPIKIGGVHRKMKRGRKPKCPFCGLTKSISKGVRETRTMGKRRLRVCKGCKRKFTVGRKAEEARKAPEKPVAASESKPAETGAVQAPAA